MPSGRSQGGSVLDAPMMKKRVLNHEVNLIQTCLQLTMIIAEAGWTNKFPYFRREARRKPNSSAGVLFRRQVR